MESHSLHFALRSDKIIIIYVKDMDEIERGFALAADKSSGAIKVTIEP